MANAGRSKHFITITLAGLVATSATFLSVVTLAGGTQGGALQVSTSAAPASASGLPWG